MKIIHVEAGLRSFDRSMPEEINKVINAGTKELSISIITLFELYYGAYNSKNVQKNKGVCIMRWDNAPHHQTITTFPFHKHIGKNEDVVDSEAMSLKKVLEIIKNRIK